MKQYIEQNLDAADLTFARLASGVIEEMDAINKYEQRIAREDNQDVVDVLVEAQKEEMKHFAMQVELLCRREETFKTILQAILFQEGDIVENGVAAEKKAEQE